MIQVEISFSMIITTNKLISQEGKIFLFSAFLSLHYCGTEPGFQSSGSGKGPFVSCAVCRIYDCRL